MNILHETQFIFYLKSHDIDLKEYDYKEGKTTDQYKENHPFIQYGRRYYQNPHLWTILISRKLQDGIDYMLGLEDLHPDVPIIKASLSGAYIINNITKKLIKLCLDRDGENNKTDLDMILTTLAETNQLSLFKDTIRLAENRNIEPLYENYVNAGDGSCLTYACDHEDNKFADYLIDQGADASLNASIAFAKACKKGKYGFALKLIDHGADLHSRNNLGLKMLERNDRLGLLYPGEEENRKILYSRYKKDEEES